MSVDVSDGKGAGFKGGPGGRDRFNGKDEVEKFGGVVFLCRVL